MSALNPDVYAADVLRDHYRHLMDWQIPEMAKAVAETQENLDGLKARLETAKERANSLMETLIKLPPPEEQPQ